MIQRDGRSHALGRLPQSMVLELSAKDRDQVSVHLVDPWDGSPSRGSENEHVRIMAN